MQQCPYCTERKINKAGLSSHIKISHKPRWKGTLADSLPPRWKLGTDETRWKDPVAKSSPVAARTARIAKYEPCPFCDTFTPTNHPPALARHLLAAHRDKWKGSLEATLGRKMVRGTRSGGRRKLPPLLMLEEARIVTRKPNGNRTPDKAEALRKRRAYSRIYRERFRKQGLTSTGKPYKRKMAKTLVLTEHVEHPPVEARIVKRVRTPDVMWHTRNQIEELLKDMRHEELVDLVIRLSTPARAHINYCVDCGGPVSPYEQTKARVIKGAMGITHETEAE